MKLTPAEVKIQVLKALLALDRPSGATQVAEILRGWGTDLSDRNIRSHLLQLDVEKLTILKSPREGRMLTEAGRERASQKDVLERMAFVSGQIDEMNYRMGFSLRTGKGSLVVNTTLLHTRDASKALDIVRPVFAARLGMGTRLALLQAGASYDIQKRNGVPPDFVALTTVCSVSFNGICLKEGIPVTSRYGGLMEFRKGTPRRFVELLAYGGTTQDPLELFIRAKMTSVSKCARTGNGIVGASFREFPSVALPEVLRIRDQLKTLGLNGIVAIGSPNQPLFGLPVGEGRTGLVLLGGLNPIAALSEAGMDPVNHSLAGLIDFGQFSEYPYVKITGQRKNRTQ